MRQQLRLQLSPEIIQPFCQRHHIRKLYIFGSVLRDDFTLDSDLDILVEFEPDQIPGLAFFELQDELSEILQCRVDLNTVGFLSPQIREKVLAEAVLQYAKP
ncbi:nucleotidyltransferase family protein [Spirulina subsalsa FACHB-351]|uniref:Nucleotidyltransferase family protein n=1 Tax=Spirulina subsalsa FACHB-351 TaxID=234711 RepID=A0ABT3LAY4_9CYAN|nr:nucleotidyltransferase family protein [Spirulina subsalsa]MCW6038675.1 nucleotidyltransferase family protein [Spirulina subsalsa FACHB-351]